MYKNATKCSKTQSKWCINKHGASKIIDTFETYQAAGKLPPPTEIDTGAPQMAQKTLAPIAV
jgi:hypothetical protein